MNALRGEGPKYRRSAEATAEILNLHWDPGQPKAILFGRILFVILAAMHKAEEDLNECRFNPSEN